MNHIGRKLLVPAVGIALAGSSFAFLASNTVDTSYAGQGVGTIAGYQVSNIHYTTAVGSNVGGSGNNNTAYITAVTFTLDNPAAPDNVTAVVNEPGPGHNFTYGECTSWQPKELSPAAEPSFRHVFTCTNPSADAITGDHAVDGLAPTNPGTTDATTQLTVLAAS